MNKKDLYQYINQLEKALEKACIKLEESEWQDGRDYHYITKNEWKEKLLKEATGENK